MKAHNIYIEKYDWLVRVYMNVSKSDVEEILHVMFSCGCREREIKIANKNMLSSKNNGFTYSNMRDKLSIVVLGRSTSPKEFLDTFTHEIMHLSIHIAKRNDIDYTSEEVCYIGGDVAKELYPYCKEYLCCHCHK